MSGEYGSQLRTGMSKKVPTYVGNVHAGIILLECQMMEFNKVYENWSEVFISVTSVQVTNQ